MCPVRADRTVVSTSFSYSLHVQVMLTYAPAGCAARPGAAVTEKDAANERPLDIALTTQQWPAVRLLVSVGALTKCPEVPPRPCFRPGTVALVGSERCQVPACRGAWTGHPASRMMMEWCGTQRCECARLIAFSMPLKSSGLCWFVAYSAVHVALPLYSFG